MDILLDIIIRNIIRLKMNNYKGWTIKYWPIGSQHWKATKHGINLCGNSKELLYQMIDLRSENKDLIVR